MEKHYYKIDFIGQNGFSVCISSNDEILTDEIVDYGIQAGVIDKEDVEDFIVQAEEITDDDYEMNFWQQQAIAI